MSEERIIPERRNLPPPHPSPLFLDQCLPIVAGGVRRALGARYTQTSFNVSFYTEQLLTICLGLTLALAYIADTSRPRHWFDWAAVVLSIGLCAYITVRYATLTDEAAQIPLSGLIVSGLLILLIMEASRRTNGWGFVSMIAAMAIYVYISPHLPGDFQTRYVSPQRMTVYLGLDINGAIGSILQVAVMVVISFTISVRGLRELAVPILGRSGHVR